jgi:hypothetical protein
MVVGSGLGANLLVKFVDALYDVGRIFEQPVVVRDKQFRFNPMPVIAESRPLTQRTYDQWQHWIETTVQQYEAVAA